MDVTLPEGIWTVFTLFHYPYLEDDHIVTMNPEAVDILINAVYEPMYQHFSKYFGNTFRGFFSDEPYIMPFAFLPEKDKSLICGNMPYNRLLMEKLLEKDPDAALKLPSILYHIDGISPDFRVKYMDTASGRYAEHFCKHLGDWSRAHGAEYIGHIIEDNICVKMSGEEITLDLEPYNSVFVILGDVDWEIENSRDLSQVDRFEIPADYEVSLAEGSEDYTFRPYLHMTELCNINALPGMDRFAGHIKYETDFDLAPRDFEKLELCIEEAGETVNVSVNQKATKVRIVPPYRFDITDLVKEGKNHLEIIVTTHMGYRQRDIFSRFMVLEPTGLSGKVEIVKYK